MQDRVPAERDDTSRIETGVVKDRADGPRGESEYRQIVIDGIRFWVAVWRVE